MRAVQGAQGKVCARPAGNFQPPDMHQLFCRESRLRVPRKDAERAVPPRVGRPLRLLHFHRGGPQRLTDISQVDPLTVTACRYVSQLEARIAALEIELSKYTVSSEFTSDHGLAQTQAQAQAAAVDALTKQFPPGTWPALALAPTDSAMTGTGVLGAAEESATHDVPVEVKTELEPQEEDEEDLARGIGLLSLSGSGEPVYVGASSGINWARVCAT